LLVHGLMVGDRVRPGLDTFDAHIVRALRQAGFDVRLPALPAVAPSTERAVVLASAIDELLRTHPGQRVLIIAHSQAGIDARVLLREPRMRERIAAVATLSTPHHGTELAEIGERLYGSLVESIMNRASRRIAESRGWPGREGHARALIASITPREMARLDALPPPAVPFFSIAATPDPATDGSCDGGWWPPPQRHGQRHALLAIAGAILTDAIGPGRAHDGLVPTARQRFGEFLGCAPIDHMGWLDSRNASFDVSAFLVELARGLRDAGRADSVAPMRSHAAALARLAAGR
jgi:triacylglycerol lipase